MVKVCHFTSSHQPEDTRIFKKECVSLAKAGYCVYLVQRGKSYSKDGVKIKGFKIDKINRFTRFFVLSYRAYKTAQLIDADIYHFHDPELLPFGYILKKRGKMVIFDSHENNAESIKEKTGIPKALRYLIYLIYSSFEKMVCKKLDGVIYVTPNVRENFKKLNSNIELITNYPILSKDSRFEVPQYPKIFYAGNVCDQWSIKQILNAINGIDDIKFIICGRADSEYLKIVEKSKSWSKVEYKGLVDHKDVHEIMKSCNIGMSLLQPSDNTDWENGTMGNTKIFEQMMAGLPIICTNFKLWRKFVEKYKCGICVDPNNPSEISNAIISLISNKELCLDMGNNARKAVENEFNWCVQEQKLLSFYNRIIQRKG